MKSQTIKLPRSVAKEIMQELRVIASMDKTPGISAGGAYAHALGRCNGIAKGLLITMEVYLPK